MNNGDRTQMTDLELDKLLAAASRPAPLPGFEQRLAQRMAAQGAQGEGSNVIAFRPRKAAPAPSRAARWPFAAALAASLAIGLWLGGSGQLSNLIDPASDTAMLDSSTGFAPAGLEDLGNADVDNLS